MKDKGRATSWDNRQQGLMKEHSSHQIRGWLPRIPLDIYLYHPYVEGLELCRPSTSLMISDTSNDSPHLFQISGSTDLDRMKVQS